jgi:hypothetical protein
MIKETKVTAVNGVTTFSKTAVSRMALQQKAYKL